MRSLRPRWDLSHGECQCLLSFFTRVPDAEADRRADARLGGGEGDKAGQAAIERQEPGRCFAQKVAQLTGIGGGSGELPLIRSGDSILLPRGRAPVPPTTTPPPPCAKAR